MSTSNHTNQARSISTNQSFWIRSFAYLLIAFLHVGSGNATTLTNVTETTELPDCNPRSFDVQLFSYSERVHVEGPLPPRRLSHRIRNLPASRSRVGLTPQNTPFAFGKSSMFYIDLCPDNAQRTCVHAIDMHQQAAELFDAIIAPGTPFCSVEMKDPISVPGFEDTQCYLFRLYQKHYMEHHRVLTFDARSPRNLEPSNSGEYVTWVEDGPNPGRSIIKIFDNKERSTLLFPMKELNTRHGSGTFSIDNPGFSGDVLRFLLTKYGANDEPIQSIVYIYSLSSKHLEAVSVPHLWASVLVSQTSFLRTPNVFGKVSDGVVAWISSPSQQHTNANIVLDILTLPKRHLLQLPMSKLGDPKNNFTTLVDLRIAEDVILVVVSDELGTQFKIRILHLHEATSNHTTQLRDVQGSLSDTVLKFASQSGPSLLYWKMGHPDDVDGYDELRLLSIVDISHTEDEVFTEDWDDAWHDGTASTHCKVMNASDAIDITQVSLYIDTVVWVRDVSISGSGETDKSGGEFVIELLDLDKDNDGVFDINDLFPFVHGYSKDSDGDGLADALDFIDGGFGSDNEMLYTLWITFVVVIATSTVLYIVAHKHYVIESQIVSETTSNQFALVRHQTGVGTQKQATPNSNPNSKQGKDQPKHKTSITLNPRAMLQKMSSGAIHINTNGESAIEDGESELSSNDKMLQYLDDIYEWVEVFLTTLTLGSIILTIVPLYPLGGVSPKTFSLCVWLDFFMTTIFLIDLVTRFIMRDRKEFPTVLSFLTEYWYDIPALLTDIPMTSVSFPNLLGLTKGFRAVRLWRRFTQQTVFISIMVKKPIMYLTTFVALMIVSTAVFIKILEQEENELFRDGFNVMWFAIVSVTTVGYGDMNPKTPTGRILTIFLMLTGIGLISTLSAFTVAKIVAIGKTEQKIRQMKEELNQRFDTMYDGLVSIATPYNPVAGAILGLKGNISNAERQIAQGHLSSTLNVMVGMNTQIELPVDKVMKGAGGKFTVNNISSQAELIRSIAKEQEQRVLLDIVEETGSSFKHGTEATPRSRLSFILRKFQLSTVVHNFDEMVDELANIAFEPPRPNKLYLMKIFAMRQVVLERYAKRKTIEFVEFDYQDPMDHKIALVEEHLERYGVHHRVDYHEIVNEMTKLLVMYDRVESVKWGLENLQYKATITPPLPPLRAADPPLANMPKVDVMLEDGATAYYMMAEREMMAAPISLASPKHTTSRFEFSKSTAEKLGAIGGRMSTMTRDG